MRRMMAAGVLAALAGFVMAPAAAGAQSADPEVQAPVGPPPGEATNPHGARYYPGIGFRYALPPGERVYGYYRGPRVYGYSQRARVYGYRSRARDRWWCPWW
jgi:hypothetical protein